MAQEPADEAAAASQPATQMSQSRGSGTPVVLNDRFNIFPSNPLPAFGSPTAQAFLAEDRRDPAARLFALVCDPSLPQRINVMRSMKGQRGVGVLTLMDWGSLEWPLTRHVHIVVIYEEPLGGRINPDPRARLEQIREHEILRKVIQPLMNGLHEYHDRGLTHRAIRANNLFYMDQGRQTIVLGECVSAPPGYDQPATYEPIPQGLSLREGRGPGTVETDLYAMGVALIVLLTGRNPMSDLSEAEIVRRKINQGSYTTLVNDQRLPLPLIEVLRGVLSDDPNQRWDLESMELWLAGRRLSPIQTKPAPRAQRAFPLCGGDYWNCRELAAAIGKNWDTAVGTLKSGTLEQWLRRSLDDKGRAETVSAALKVAEANTTDTRAAIDFLCTRISVILDPDAPIRYQGLAIMPDGFGLALATATMQRRETKKIAEIITRDIPRLWFEGHEGYNTDHVLLSSEFREVRPFIVMKEVGYGVERVLYELNESLPCQSPLIADRFVTEVHEILPALEEAARRVEPKEWPVDRHIAAFINARYDLDLEPQMVALNNESPERALTGMLSVLAVLQYRGGPESVSGVAAWCAHLMAPVIDSYHNRDRRKYLQREIGKVAKKGKLADMFSLLDSNDERQKDRDGFAMAKATYASADAEIKRLEKGGRSDEQADRIGHNTAAVTSLVICAITFSLLFIVRLW